MARIITVLTLVLSILLFPPAALALISNNAVPGDATYPIKRFLEDRIYDVASLNPTTKAWFSAARSDRRFQELTTLLTQGKQTEQTLKELVEQTEIAANQVTQIANKSQKEKLIEQLSQSITKYDEKLQQVTPAQPLSTPISTAEVTPVPMPIGKLRPTPTPQVIPTPKPTPTALPTILPTPQPQPLPPSDQPDDIEEARKKLEDIKKKLEEEKKKVQKGFGEDRIDRKHDKEGKDEVTKEERGDKENDDEKINIKDKKEEFKTDKKSDN